MLRRSRPEREETLAELLEALPDDLRRQAFTHASWVEHRAESYERLAFLGDVVLSLAVSTHLFPRFERYGAGRLTKVRAQAAFRSGSRRIKVVRWHAGEGASGTHVLVLQRLLRSLGYPSPVTGGYDQATSLAVLAYRKTNNMGRAGSATAAVYDKVLRGRGRFKLRHPRAGKHVEFDWSRQVVVLADRGRPWRVYHASSGTAATPTVFGAYRFYSKTPGVNSKQMLHSNYFIGGYAIHGYPSVPNYPASHGCIRVPNRSADDINGWIRLGDPIYVYT